MLTILLLLALATVNGFAIQDKSNYQSWLAPMQIPEDLMLIIHDYGVRDGCGICKDIANGIKDWMSTNNNVEVLNFLNNGCNLAFQHDKVNHFWCQNGMEMYYGNIAMALVMEYGDAQGVCQHLGQCSPMILPMPVTQEM